MKPGASTHRCHCAYAVAILLVTVLYSPTRDSLISVSPPITTTTATTASNRYRCRGLQLNYHVYDRDTRVQRPGASFTARTAFRGFTWVARIPEIPKVHSLEKSM